ncbi:MAG: hypothetical protein KAI03_02670 [Candidatus Aureabacteria bacterium]|nr:hypothetical protein [Candidatus Auribacterota bacterium]
MKKIFQDKRNLVILLLGVLYLAGIPRGGVRYALWVMGGIAICAAVDFLINKYYLKIKLVPKSAVISGFIVAGILDYRESWIVLIIFSLLAVFSKHIIKYKKKHIYNPANAALFIAALFKYPLTWSIESNIYLIIIFGAFFVYSLKKHFHILGFLTFFMPLFYFFGEVNPVLITSWFFLFVMLIEPKTSGFGVLRGFLFGSAAGIFSFLIFKIFPGRDFFVPSLFIANSLNPVLDWAKKRLS